MELPTILDKIKWNDYPPPKKNNDDGTKEQKRAIFESLKLGEGWFKFLIYFVQDCNLGQNKMKQLSPIPAPLKQWWRREGAKPRHLASSKWERGGSDFSFILSKIVGSITIVGLGWGDVDQTRESRGNRAQEFCACFELMFGRWIHASLRSSVVRALVS